MFGSHLSIAGGMFHALEEARRLGLDCVQVFTKNQKQWRVGPLKAEDRAEWFRTLDAVGWRTFDSPPRTVSHNSYLINLASADPSLRARSIALQRDEIERCEALEIPYLVSHPGAHLGAPRTRGDRNQLDRDEHSADEVAGLRRIAAAIDQLHAELPGYRTVTCLETTVGSGTNLGYHFGHLRFIRDAVRQPERIGFCLDTCHVTAAGYDMTTDANAAAVLDRFDAVCGLDRLFVIHLNDSVGDVGSRLDRHAHIGKGRGGLACFRVVVNHPRLRGVPMILETPKEFTAAGTPYDLINVRKLRRMIDSAQAGVPSGIVGRRSRPKRAARR
jgi:deoxyribonuclease-4